MILLNFMCNIVKISNGLILLLLITINSSYAVSDGNRYEKYRKKYYMNKQKNIKIPREYPKQELVIEKKKQEKTTRFNIGINLSTKYIQYNDEKFKTSNGTYTIDGNKINPVMTVGGGPEIGIKLYKILNIFARGNIYLKAEKKNENTGLRWDQTLEKFGVKSELSIMEASTGLTIDIPLPELGHLQQKMYLGGGIGLSRYEFDWHYLSNGSLEGSRSSNINSTSYDAILGYKIRNSKYDNYKIELIVTGFEELPGVKYNANLILGYFYTF